MGDQQTLLLFLGRVPSLADIRRPIRIASVDEELAARVGPDCDGEIRTGAVSGGCTDGATPAIGAAIRATTGDGAGGSAATGTLSGEDTEGTAEVRADGGGGGGSITKHLADNGKYVRYTAEQVEALERVYAECPKPSSLRRQQLIRECPILCNIEPKQIKVWFQNRRSVQSLDLVPNCGFYSDRFEF